MDLTVLSTKHSLSHSGPLEEGGVGADMDYKMMEKKKQSEAQRRHDNGSDLSPQPLDYESG